MFQCKEMMEKRTTGEKRFLLTYDVYKISEQQVKKEEETPVADAAV
jgi:hypothetical protein